MLKRKDFLNLLAKSKTKKRRNALVDLGDSSEIKAVAEIIANVLEGNVALDENQLRKLRRHKKKLRLIAQKRHSVKRKKALIKQTGGIIGALIPLAISTVASLVKNLVK